MPSPLDMQIAMPAPGAPQVAPQGSAPPVGATPLEMDLTAASSALAAPSAGQLARAAWNSGGQTLQVQPGALLGIPGTFNTHIPVPQWLEHQLIFQGRGVHDVGQGIENAGRWIGDKLTGKPYQAPAQTASDRIMAAAERQQPAYNFLAKWPAEFAASLPLGESAGALAGRGVEALGLAAPDAAPLWQRALSALPQSSAVGAAYGAQQRQGSPGVNAAIGAVAGPVLEAGMRGAGALASKGGDAVGALWRGITRSVPDQGELDARVGNYLRSIGAPGAVAPRAAPEGVAFPTAVHANDPALLDLQGKERAGQRAIPFHELATQNDAAIVNGLRRNLAPQPDSNTVSNAAHDLLQGAKIKGKAVVTAAYQPFDEVKGGVYLDREPIQRSLREAHAGLLPSQQEILPAKVRELMEADHPLHLKNDIEDLGARLSDAIGAAPKGTPASRSLMIMRDALDKGVEDAPLANQADPGALAYDPARAPLPRRNMAESDPREDSILQWLAKHPKGMSSEEAVAQGLDPADLRGSAARVGIRRAFRQGGMSFDQAAEALHQAGYPVADERGNYDPNTLLNAVDAELRGKPVYSVANTRASAELSHEAAIAVSPSREPPDLTDLAARAMQANPERAQAALDSWTDDRPETLARVQAALQEAVNPGAGRAPDAVELWKNAKAANKAFRDRFPQGTARDTEARSWLSKWLSGRKEPGRFLTEATVLPGHAKAVLDAMGDDPQAQEQMRQMMRNNYVNRLLSNTRASVPGERLLNADALTRARTANSAIERVILKPNESALLDRYVGAARDNAKILQRSINGSSETASLLQHQASKGDELLGSRIVHAAAKVHPVAGALAHMLLPRGAGEAAAEALQGTLTNALLDPEVYNRVMGAENPESVFLKLLKAGKMGAIAGIPRGAAFTLPQQLAPALSGTR